MLMFLMASCTQCKPPAAFCEWTCCCLFCHALSHFMILPEIQFSCFCPNLLFELMHSFDFHLLLHSPRFSRKSNFVASIAIFKSNIYFSTSVHPVNVERADQWQEAGRHDSDPAVPAVLGHARGIQ